MPIHVDAVDAPLGGECHEEGVLGQLKEALKGQDTDRIRSLTQELEQASYKMAEAMYAGVGRDAAGSGVDAEHGMDESGTAGGGSSSSGRPGGDDVVDAEFRTTDDRK